MCGICGVIGIESKDAGETIVRRMMAAMVHRGPDEEGILLASPVAVGMRRLSIVDLPGGSQPVWNETETLAVVYNGEIYNFRELRAELEALGHRFRTRSDTEVIVHAYESWGERCVERLHGMFAFAVVEMPQGRGGRAARVFLARDPLGIKPLYYALVDGKLLFASEVRALLASGCVPARISSAAISGVFAFRLRVRAADADRRRVISSARPFDERARRCAGDAGPSPRATGTRRARVPRSRRANRPPLRAKQVRALLEERGSDPSHRRRSGRRVSQQRA